MKEIEVRLLSECPEAEKVPQWLDENGVEYNDIDTVDWAEEYPYKPEVKVRIAHTGKHIVLHYTVKEETIKAVAQDNGNVWEDSCCEFFSQPAGDAVYYNVECNCAGQMLIGSGATRKERDRAPQAVLDTVERWSSNGRTPFEEKPAPAEWQLVLKVPMSAFYHHQLGSLSGKRVRANFYKCGDKQQKTHFLSWNKIELPTPNFHCPEFFGVLEFEAPLPAPLPLR